MYVDLCLEELDSTLVITLGFLGLRADTRISLSIIDKK